MAWDNTIMIIGAGQEHCIGITTARRMGLKVLSTDENPASPGFKIAVASKRPALQ